MVLPMCRVETARNPGLAGFVLANGINPWIGEIDPMLWLSAPWTRLSATPESAAIRSAWLYWTTSAGEIHAGRRSWEGWCGRAGCHDAALYYQTLHLRKTR
jgi:hypothetical protein